MNFKKIPIISLFFLVTLNLYSQDWVQTGHSLYGENEKDFMGKSVSISDDGTTIAVGVPRHDGKRKNSGCLKVYKFQNYQWVQMGNDILGAPEDKYFGNVISLSSDGSIVAVAVNRNGKNKNNSGEVRIYKFDGEKWIQLGNDIICEFSSDFFGISLSLNADGKIVAIGATISIIKKNIGKVRVFKYNGENWQIVGNEISGKTSKEFFGSSVNLSADGSVVAIGAFNYDEFGIGTGQVRVYKNISETWNQIGENLTGSKENDMFGWSVCLNSDASIIAVGASGMFHPEKKGYIRIYRNNNGSWQQLGDDIYGNEAGDVFGYSLSLSSDGSTIVVGAYNNESGSGQVRVYKYSGQNWKQLGKDINGDDFDNFGFSVSLSSDGTSFAVGALRADSRIDPLNPVGNVKVYKLLSGNKHFQFSDTLFEVGQTKEILIEYSLSGGTMRDYESKNNLDSLVYFLKKNKHINIEIGVHTDFRGSDESQIALSERRAKSLKEYLVREGINEERMITFGYGLRDYFVVDSLTNKKYDFFPIGTVLSIEYVGKLSNVEEFEIACRLNNRVEIKIVGLN